jgi:hypothetical protein
VGGDLSRWTQKARAFTLGIHIEATGRASAAQAIDAWSRAYQVQPGWGPNMKLTGDGSDQQVRLERNKSRAGDMVANFTLTSTATGVEVKGRIGPTTDRRLHWVALALLGIVVPLVGLASGHPATVVLLPLALVAAAPLAFANRRDLHRLMADIAQAIDAVTPIADGRVP